MTATITYGSVANTPHSAKHCRGEVVRTQRSVVASGKRLNKGITGSEYRMRESATLAAIHRANTAHLYDYDFDDQGNLTRTLAREEVMDMSGQRLLAPLVKRQRERENDYDTQKSVKMFKSLPQSVVSCSARGVNGGGTTEQSVSSRIKRSADVDNVSSMTGQVPLSSDGRHVTKISDKAYAKERTRFMDSMVKRQVQKGKACWMPAVKKANKLRTAALRNSARA